MKEHVSVILYPIFLKCCKYLTDSYWVYLFEDMAYGKCPFGILIQDQCIYSILKNREFRYPFDQNKDPEEMTKELCHIFTNRLQLLSVQDHFRFRNECQDYVKNYMNNISSWNDIRKKNLKDILLEQYALTQRIKYNYSWSFTRTLFAIIFIGIQFKTLASRSIHYRNRSIQSIDGIVCLPNKISCSNNIFLTKQLPIHREPLPKSITKISFGWKRYLLSL